MNGVNVMCVLPVLFYIVNQGCFARVSSVTVKYIGKRSKHSGMELNTTDSIFGIFEPPPIVTPDYSSEMVQDLPQEHTSDTWIFCHGMTTTTFVKACDCMLELKQEMAKRTGLDPKTVKDRWPVLEDHIYSPHECHESLNLLKQQENQTSSRRHKRKLYYDEFRKWTFPVRYEYHADISAEDKQMIRAAILHWEEMTCVLFEKYAPNVHSEYEQRLLFTNRPNGCYSYVGKQYESFPQQINLETEGCASMIGVVVHEIGHALGLIHEQNRIDRHLWVNFHPQYVEARKENNDMDFNADPLGVPYDYGSVMHYDTRAYSNGKGRVWVANKPYSEYVMGQRGLLSFLDAEVINKGYCPKVCADKTLLPCLHGGYMDPKDCQKCRCPEGLGGRFCDTAAASHLECSPKESMLTVNASDELQCLKSPGYDTREYYQLGIMCSWVIEAPPGQTIRARFDGPFGVFCFSNTKRGPICLHWVEIKYLTDKRQRGARFCCYDIRGHPQWNYPPKLNLAEDPFSQPGVVRSEGNLMVVHFDARWPQAGNKHTMQPTWEARRGFKLCFALSADYGSLSNDTEDDGAQRAVNEFFSRDSGAPPLPLLLADLWGIYTRLTAAFLWLTLTHWI